MSLTSCHCSTPQRALAEPCDYITRGDGVKDGVWKPLQASGSTLPSWKVMTIHVDPQMATHAAKSCSVLIAREEGSESFRLK